MQTDNKNTLQNAIRALASVCDGAESLDGAGFNKADARWGALMALDDEEQWHPSHKWGAWVVLQKYRNQLQRSFGIDYDAIPVPPECHDYAELPELPKPRPRIKASGQAFVIAFNYDPALVSAVKRIPGARFDGVTKRWSAQNTPGVADAVRTFAADNGFDFSPEAAALLDTEPVKPVINLAQRKIVPHGKDWKLIYPYDATLVAAIKSLTSRRKFDPDTKSWICESSEQLFAFCEKYDFAGREALRAALDATAQLAAETSQANDTLTQMLIDAAGDLNQPLPGARQIVLRKHQQEAVIQLLARKRAILAHDMGLGKSLTALVAARAAQDALDAHIFVVAPVSLRTNWMREAEEAGVKVEFFSWAKVPQAPESDRPVVVIFDEAHYAQNLKAARTKGAVALAEKALMAFFLTGTPIKNGRPVNLFPLLVGCQHDLARNKRAYEMRYCAAKETRWTRWDVSGAAHLDELHTKTQDVLFRKTKAQCLDLPALTRVKREAEVTAEQAQAFAAVRAHIIAVIEERKRAGTLKGSEALELLTSLRVAGSRAKTDTAIELAEEVIEQGGQVIVSTQFQETAQSIAQALNCEALTGATPGDQRQGMVDRFQSGQRKAIVFTGGAGGVGLNVQAANTVILVDRPWTPGDAEQIESRAHRSGVSHPVTSIWLQYNSVDAKIDALLELKQTRIEQVLEGERKTMRGVSRSVASVALEALGVEWDDAEWDDAE
jgi:hypothetical protein